jgi:hypothetical protein
MDINLTFECPGLDQAEHKHGEFLKVLWQNELTRRM